METKHNFGVGTEVIITDYMSSKATYGTVHSLKNQSRYHVRIFLNWELQEFKQVQLTKLDRRNKTQRLMLRDNGIPI